MLLIGTPDGSSSHESSETFEIHPISDGNSSKGIVCSFCPKINASCAILKGRFFGEAKRVNGGAEKLFRGERGSNFEQYLEARSDAIQWQPQIGAWCPIFRKAIPWPGKSDGRT
jgi:hypothetical protein